MKKIILSMLLTLAPAAAQAERIGAAHCRIDTPAKVRDEGTEIHLWVRGLPAKNAVYEVLCDAEEWTATAGTFRTDAQGRGYVVLTTALRQGEYNAIRIVRRSHRKDGRPYKRNVLTARLS